MINTVKISGDRFTWKKNIGSAEMSDLKDIVGDRTPLHIIVESHKTGEIRDFWFCEMVGDTEMTENDDISHWVYMTNNGLLTLMLFND